MPDKAFLDTNVLIYLYSEDEPEKAALALHYAQNPDTWISTQVLNEVCNVLRRKQKLAYADILNVVQELQTHFSVATVISRIQKICNIGSGLRAYCRSLILLKLEASYVQSFRPLFISEKSYCLYLAQTGFAQ